MQHDLFATYPDRPGYRENTTSRDAARAMEPRAGTLRARVLDVLRHAELTPDEIANELTESILAVRPRVTELFRMHLIERTGERRMNVSRMRAHVYRLAP